MGSTDWRVTALDDLLRIDRYRKRYRLQPIRHTLFETVSAYLAAYPKQRLLPGQPVSHPDLPPGNVRLTRIYVGRKSGPYRVIFRYHAADSTFEILRVMHPRENAGRT